MSAEEKSYETKRLRSSDLYKAAEAVSKLEALIGNSVSAKEQLIDNVRDGKLKVYARYRWTTQQLDRRKFLSTRPGNIKHIRKIVDKKLFKGTDNIIELIHDWDWANGRFYLPRMPKGRRPFRIMLQDVRFRRDDIDLMVEIWKRATKSKVNSGRTEDHERWDEFMVAIFNFARDEERVRLSSVQKAPFFAEFRSFYEKMYPDKRLLGESTYDRRLRLIYHVLRDERASKAKQAASP